MTNYAEMGPLALNRLAAERAGHILAPEDENLGGDYFIVVSKELAAYSKSAPDDEYDLTYYGYGPDYTGSVDAALQLPVPDFVSWRLTHNPGSGYCHAWLELGIPTWRAGLPDDFHEPEVSADELARAMVESWLELDDALTDAAARAGKGEG